MSVGYTSEIKIRYGQLKEMLAWCANNCVDKWQYSVVDAAGESPGIYNFQFNSKDDYINFLMWCK